MIFIASLMSLILFNADVSAKISYLSGTVTIQRSGTTYSGALGTQLAVGDVVATPAQSACEIQFENYSLVRLAQNSSLKIERKEKTAKGVFHRIFASLGQVVTKVTKLGKNDQYEVRTDVAQAYIRGTTFQTTIEQNGESQFQVYEGKLRVKSLLAGAKEVVVKQNFKGVFGKTKAAPIVAELSDLEVKGFNRELKEFLDRGAVLDKLRERASKEIDEGKELINDKAKELKKSCIFW